MRQCECLLIDESFACCAPSLVSVGAFLVAPATAAKTKAASLSRHYQSTLRLVLAVEVCRPVTTTILNLKTLEGDMFVREGTGLGGAAPRHVQVLDVPPLLSSTER